MRLPPEEVSGAFSRTRERKPSYNSRTTLYSCDWHFDAHESTQLGMAPGSRTLPHYGHTGTAGKNIHGLDKHYAAKGRRTEHGFGIH